MIGSRAQDLLTVLRRVGKNNPKRAVLRRVGKSNPKRAEVHEYVDIFFDSLDRITERQADWELDLLQDAVLSIMTDARKE